MPSFKAHFSETELTLESFTQWWQKSFDPSLHRFAENTLIEICRDVNSHDNADVAQMCNLIWPLVQDIAVVSKALIWVADRGDFALAQSILEQKEKIFPNAQWDLSESLDRAITSKNEAMIFLILPHCDISKKINVLLIQAVQADQPSLIDKLLTLSTVEGNMGAFRWTIMLGNLPLLDKFLEFVDPRWNHSKALHVAARFKKVEVFHRLLDVCNLQDARNHHAAVEDEKDADRFMKEQGAIYEKNQLLNQTITSTPRTTRSARL